LLSRADTLSSRDFNLPGRAFKSFQIGMLSRIFNKSETVMGNMDNLTLPKVVAEIDGVVRVSLAVKQLKVYRNVKGSPVLAILQGDSRTEIEIDDAAKDHLVGLLQAL